jgi:copper chaperone CopZ
MKGISPGAAFVFLVVGPATNAASLTVIASSLGRKVTAVYVFVLTVCALLFGLLLNFMVEKMGVVITVRHGAHIMSRSIILDIITVIFSIILILSFWRKYKPRSRKRTEETTGVNMKNFKIADMHCNHCVKAISAALEELEEIKDFKIELADRTLQVEGEISEQNIMEAVKAVGYNIELIKDSK